MPGLGGEISVTYGCSGIHNIAVDFLYILLGNTGDTDLGLGGQLHNHNLEKVGAWHWATWHDYVNNFIKL